LLSALPLAAQTVADAWNGQPGLAPGAWVNITGSDLIQNPVSWTPRAGKPLSSSLAGATVKVNGISAAVAFASPTRIQFLTPDRLPPGDVTITVEPGNLTITAKSGAALPALYAVAEGSGASRKYQVLAAPAGAGLGLSLVTDRGWLLGKPGSDPRVARAVTPGEEIELFATGLGPTEPEFPTDRLFTESYSVDEPVTVTFGETSVEATSVDLIQPGIYRIRVVAPNSLAPGEVPLSLETGGVKSTAPVYLFVEGA
jgi:uncharacterized protein (TIGR03437 family)